jgi:hypothetical protein
VETDAIRVTTNRPNQDDVSRERASIVGLGRDIYGPHSPTIDRQRTERTNASASIPSRAIDQLGVVSKRSRGGDDDEVLIARFARTKDPAPPRLRAASGPAWTDDVEFTPPDSSGRAVSRRHSRWTRNGVANFVGRCSALSEKFRRCWHEARGTRLSRPLRHGHLISAGAGSTRQRRERDGQKEESHFLIVTSARVRKSVSPPPFRKRSGSFPQPYRYEQLGQRRGTE